MTTINLKRYYPYMTASWAHEIMSALRRLFFFCRRPADCSVIKGLMFLDILKTIYK